MPFVIILFTILILIYIFYESPSSKGRRGESSVRTILDEYNEYTIHDLIFKDGDKSIQIDHIVINSAGVFVMETKNYKGRIYGSENELNWTQVLAYGKRKYKLYNPIKQNKSHIFHLRNILNTHAPFFSIIVLVGNNAKYIDSLTPVVPSKNLNNVIKQISNNNIVLSNDEIITLFNRLKVIKEGNPITNKEHIQNIKLQRKNIKKNKCPRCGRDLVLRKGKYGQFYGCSNFPNCRFTKEKRR